MQQEGAPRVAEGAVNFGGAQATAGDAASGCASGVRWGAGGLHGGCSRRGAGGAVGGCRRRGHGDCRSPPPSAGGGRHAQVEYQPGVTSRRGISPPHDATARGLRRPMARPEAPPGLGGRGRGGGGTRGGQWGAAARPRPLNSRRPDGAAAFLLLPRATGLRPTLPSTAASAGGDDDTGGGERGGGGRLLHQRAQGCRKPVSRGGGGGRIQPWPPQWFRWG